jgi:hypothetical protein
MPSVSVSTTVSGPSTNASAKGVIVTVAVGDVAANVTCELIPA